MGDICCGLILYGSCLLEDVAVFASVGILTTDSSLWLPLIAPLVPAILHTDLLSKNSQKDCHLIL